MEKNVIAGVIIMLFGMLMLLSSPITFTNLSSPFSIAGMLGFLVFASGLYLAFRELR